MVSMSFRAEPASVVQRSDDTYQVRASDGPRFQMTNASILLYSFKLHDTALQLHEWTRSEKMKLKEQAVAEMAKEKEAQAQGEPCVEEKSLSAEAEVNETDPFEGEMDNFQTPLVRCGPSAPVLFT